MTYFVINNRKNDKYTMRLGKDKIELVDSTARIINDFRYDDEFDNYVHLLDEGYSEDQIQDVMLDDFEDADKESYLSSYGYHVVEIDRTLYRLIEAFFDVNIGCSEVSKERLNRFFVEEATKKT